MDYYQESKLFVPTGTEPDTLGVSPDTVWPLADVTQLWDLVCVKQTEIAGDMGHLADPNGATSLELRRKHRQRVTDVLSIKHAIKPYITMSDEVFDGSDDL